MGLGAGAKGQPPFQYRREKYDRIMKTVTRTSAETTIAPAANLARGTVVIRRGRRTCLNDAVWVMISLLLPRVTAS